jgi:hypothetical protein
MLFRIGQVTMKRKINEEYHTNDKVQYLKGYLIHYPFNKGICYWFERHNRYSSVEAEVLLKDAQSKLDFKQCLSSDRAVRRKFLKQLAYRLPFRPFLVFCYLYFFHLGFLYGIPRLTYCRLRSTYEFMIDLKAKELRRRECGLLL